MLFQIIGGVFCLPTGSTGIAKAAEVTYYVNSNCSSDCDGSTPAKGWTTFYYATKAANVPAGSTVEAVVGSGPYYGSIAPDVDQDNVTWNFNGVEIRGDVDTNALVNSGNYKWSASSDAGHSGYHYFAETAPTPVTSIIRNGEMEYEGGWSNYVTVSVNERNATMEHGGNFSRHVVANVGGISQSLSNLTVGATYRVSGYYYTASGGIRVSFFSNQSPLTTTGSWQYFEYDIIATGAATSLLIYYPNVTEFYVDDVKVEKLDGGGNPVEFYNPWAKIFRNSSSVLSAVVDGTWNVASTNTWTANKWSWGDFDSLGYNTLYVQWTGGNPTESNVKILAGIDAALFDVKAGVTGQVANDAHFIGSNSYLTDISEAVTFNRCLFQYAREHGIDVGTLTGGNLNGTTIINSKFIDCGHRGINIVRPVNPLNVYNNYFSGCHLMLRNDAVNGSVVNFNNNSNYNALAGSIQWINNTSVLDESNNQFNIDANSQHGGKRIGFSDNGTYNWTLSSSADIPGGFDVTSLCDSSHPENCGTNPFVDNNGSPLYISPLIDSGTPTSGITTDYLGNHIYGNPDIGAYEYQPPYTIGTDDINISSPIRIYADGKYRYTNAVSGSNDADLTVIPQTGFGTGDYSQWMDININTWHTSTDYYKKWTESSTTHDLTTTHTIGDLQPNVRYTLKVDGQASDTYVANDQGQISFTYNEGYSTKTFELEETPSSSFIAPSQPSVSDVSVTNNNGIISLTNLPTTITQIAISTSPDFTNSSWEDISKKDNLLKQYNNTDTLYIKFRTQEGGVSDTIIKEGNNITENEQGSAQDNNIDTNNSNQSLQDGDLIKTPNNPDVYVIKYKNNKQYKRLLLSPTIFNSYLHLKWNNIKTISQQQSDQYQTSNLVKETTDTIIYQLFPNNDTGKRKPLNPSTSYDPDSIYEINKPERDSYELED